MITSSVGTAKKNRFNSLMERAKTYFAQKMT